MESKQTGKLASDTRILLVDDEPDFRDAMAFTFKRKGYQVFTASNGKEAFEVIRDQKIDLVVSDIRMPGGDGVELLDRTRKEHHETPIVLLVSGYTDLSTEDAHDKGAEALFSKPFDLSTVMEAVQRLLTPRGERWSKAAERVDVDLTVSLTFESLPDAIEAKVLSLGRGGMFVSLQKGQYPNVAEAAQFKIQFDGTEASTLEGAGIVRWVRTNGTAEFVEGVGIEFTYLGEKEREQVIALVNSAKPIAYIPKK
jgi:CheY-like chemotaxis protein/Tfp pilus assembly protein PilZ